jgi:large subunit ribosomal protein L34
MKRTYQPKTRRRTRRHGFLKRMSTTDGQNVIKNRRRVGRKKLTTV